nr:hypothetical protein CFP56_66234 [Quercus suber]
MVSTVVEMRSLVELRCDFGGWDGRVSVDPRATRFTRSKIRRIVGEEEINFDNYRCNSTPTIIATLVKQLQFIIVSTVAKMRSLVELRCDFGGWDGRVSVDPRATRFTRSEIRCIVGEEEINFDNYRRLSGLPMGNLSNQVCRAHLALQHATTSVKQLQFIMVSTVAKMRSLVELRCNFGGWDGRVSVDPRATRFTRSEIRHIVEEEEINFDNYRLSGLPIGNLSNQVCRAHLALEHATTSMKQLQFIVVSTVAEMRSLVELRRDFGGWDGSVSMDPRATRFTRSEIRRIVGEEEIDFDNYRYNSTPILYLCF